MILYIARPRYLRDKPPYLFYIETDTGVYMWNQSQERRFRGSFNPERLLQDVATEKFI